MAEASFSEPVLTLAIETSNPSARTEVDSEPGVALGLVSAESCAVLGVEVLGTGERHDDLLMPAIDRLFTNLGRSPGAIHRVAVSAGSGGYTGLRIATSAANLIALATGCPVVAVPSAAVVAHAMAGRGPLVVCLASKGESAWVTRFDGDGGMVGGGSLMSAADLNLRPGETLVGDRFLPESFRDAAASTGCDTAHPNFSPEACLALSARFPPVQAGNAAPLYGREAEAVTRWRELRGKPGPG
ncbi:MAG: tRNA (adenosine(37)-N6)-threonylcarbamoyltransferase complex dimerization subunit type 1 TsaB [Planctomycetota bacterium]